MTLSAPIWIQLAPCATASEAKATFPVAKPTYLKIKLPGGEDKSAWRGGKYRKCSRRHCQSQDGMNCEILLVPCRLTSGGSGDDSPVNSGHQDGMMLVGVFGRAWPPQKSGPLFRQRESVVRACDMLCWC